MVPKPSCGGDPVYSNMALCIKYSCPFLDRKVERYSTTGNPRFGSKTMVRHCDMVFYIPV